MLKKISEDISNVACCATASPVHVVPVVMNFGWHSPVPKVGALGEGHGICPSCNARRMVETAAHLVDHVFPKAPVRQWRFITS